MKHKEIKWLAQCPGNLWSFWPLGGAIMLYQSKGDFCWVEKWHSGSILLSSTTLALVKEQGWAWAKTGGGSFLTRVRVQTPQERGSKQKGLLRIPRELPRLLVPNFQRGNHPIVSRNEQLYRYFPGIPWVTHCPFQWGEYSKEIGSKLQSGLRPP